MNMDEVWFTVIGKVTVITLGCLAFAGFIYICMWVVDLAHTIFKKNVDLKRELEATTAERDFWRNLSAEKDKKICELEELIPKRPYRS